MWQLWRIRVSASKACFDRGQETQGHTVTCQGAICTRKFKVGVLEIGVINVVYIDNLKGYDTCGVTACAGRDLAKAEARAAVRGLRKAYATAEELIADHEIDIVMNLTVPASMLS